MEVVFGFETLMHWDYWIQSTMAKEASSALRSRRFSANTCAVRSPSAMLAVNSDNPYNSASFVWNFLKFRHKIHVLFVVFACVGLLKCRVERLPYVGHNRSQLLSMLNYQLCPGPRVLAQPFE